MIHSTWNTSYFAFWDCRRKYEYLKHTDCCTSYFSWQLWEWSLCRDIELRIQQKLINFPISIKLYHFHFKCKFTCKVNGIITIYHIEFGWPGLKDMIEYMRATSRRKASRHLQVPDMIHNIIPPIFSNPLWFWYQQFCHIFLTHWNERSGWFRSLKCHLLIF